MVQMKNKSRTSRVGLRIISVQSSSFLECGYHASSEMSGSDSKDFIVKFDDIDDWFYEEVKCSWSIAAASSSLL